MPRSSDSLSTVTETDSAGSSSPTIAARIPISDATHDAAAARKYQPGEGIGRGAADGARHVRGQALAAGPVDLDAEAVGQPGTGVQIAISRLVGVVGEVGARAGDGVADLAHRPIIEGTPVRLDRRARRSRDSARRSSSFAVTYTASTPPASVAELLPELRPAVAVDRTSTLTFGAPRSRSAPSTCSTSRRATPARRWLAAVATW